MYIDPIYKQPVIRRAIWAGTEDYVTCVLGHRDSQPGPLNGDGMAWHNSFVRGVSNLLARQGRSNNVYWSSRRKEFESVKVAGDYVVYTPQKGQNRFSARFHATQYLILPLTGSITGNVLTISSMGPQRIEFFRNQNAQVPKDSNWSLESDLGTEARREQSPLINVDEIRVVIVTQIYGPLQDRVRVWLGIPDGQFNSQTCQICLAESQLLFDDEVVKLRRTNRRTTKEQGESGSEQSPTIDIPVRRKSGEKQQRVNPEESTG